MIAPRWSRLALLVAIAAPVLTHAQDRSALLLRVPTSMGTATATGRAQPGVSTASPLGFGPSWRDAFVGASYQASARGTDQDDGSASVGFGLGDASRIGVEVVITSLSTINEGFGKRIGSSFKLHRRLPGNAAIGVGVEGIMLNGDTDSDESFYAAVSKLARIGNGANFNSVMLNVGVGNGRFQSVDNFLAGKDGIGVFASAGLRLIPAATAIADWTGQDLNLGLSIAPFPKFNFVVTPAFADVTGNASDKVRFTVGFGLSHHFK